MPSGVKFRLELSEHWHEYSVKNSKRLVTDVVCSLHGQSRIFRSLIYALISFLKQLVQLILHL